MQKISSVTGLKDAIRELEEKQIVSKQLLKEDFHRTLESLRPVNLIRSTIHDAFASRGFFKDIFASIFGHAAGYVSKKVVVGSAKSPVKKLFGSILQSGIASLLTKYGDIIRETAVVIFKSVFNKKSEPEDNPV